VPEFQIHKKNMGEIFVIGKSRKKKQGQIYD